MPSPIHQALLARLAPEDRDVVNWMYEVTKTPEMAVVLWGVAHVIATDHQDWGFWQVAREVKRRIHIIEVPASAFVDGKAN